MSLHDCSRSPSWPKQSLSCKVENMPRDHLVVPAMQSHDLQEASARVDVLGLCEEQIPEYHLSSAEMDAGCGLNSKA